MKLKKEDDLIKPEHPPKLYIGVMVISALLTLTGLYLSMNYEFKQNPCKDKDQHLNILTLDPVIMIHFLLTWILLGTSVISPTIETILNPNNTFYNYLRKKFGRK